MSTVHDIMLDTVKL